MPSTASPTANCGRSRRPTPCTLRPGAKNRTSPRAEVRAEMTLRPHEQGRQAGGVSRSRRLRAASDAPSGSRLGRQIDEGAAATWGRYRPSIGRRTALAPAGGQVRFDAENASMPVRLTTKPTPAAQACSAAPDRRAGLKPRVAVPQRHANRLHTMPSRQHYAGQVVQLAVRRAECRHRRL